MVCNMLGSTRIGGVTARSRSLEALMELDNFALVLFYGSLQVKDNDITECFTRFDTAAETPAPVDEGPVANSCNSSTDTCGGRR